MSSLRLSYGNPYRSSIPPAVQPWIKPGRHSLLLFRHRWPPIRHTVVCSILTLAIWPALATWQAWLMVLGAVGLYVGWQYSFDRLEQRPDFASSRWQNSISFVRYLGGIVGLSALIWALPQLSSQLWLLYLVPLLTIGISLERIWAFALILTTIVAVLLSPFAGFRLSITAVTLGFGLREGLTRALIASFVGFTSYVLVRCLSYQNCANQEARDRMFGITATASWRSSANTIACIMRDIFSDAAHGIVANVLMYDPDARAMRVIGSSEADGLELVEDGYAFSVEEGITGWAARHRQACFLRDTRVDPERRFLHQNAFPNTRSALAVPIALDDRHLAVLEVESALPGDFAQEDLQLLESIGSHLVASHRRTTLLEVHRRLALLGQDLAERIIRVEEIPSLLKTIGETALKLLDAHIIGFYYRHPMDDQHWDRCMVGDLRIPNAKGSSITARHSLISLLIQERDIRCYAHAQSDPHLTRYRPWHRQDGQMPFVLREGVISCAAMPLILGQECIGLMWINYRRPVQFTEPLKNIIRLLAPYAGLAIQSGLQSALNERRRRAATRRVVHDSLAHRLRDVSRGLGRLGHSQPGSAGWNEELMILSSQVERAQHVVKALDGEHSSLSLQAIVDDLQKQVRLIDKIHCIQASFASCAIPDTPISIAAGNELMFACDEILANAIHHGRPQAISIQVDVVDRHMHLVVTDDGVGFDTACIRPGRGISSISERVEVLGGSVSFRSAAGQGTTVHIIVPLPNQAISEGPCDAERSETRPVDRE